MCLMVHVMHEIKLIYNLYQEEEREGLKLRNQAEETRQNPMGSLAMKKYSRLQKETRIRNKKEKKRKENNKKNKNKRKQRSKKKGTRPLVRGKETSCAGMCMGMYVHV